MNRKYSLFVFVIVIVITSAISAQQDPQNQQQPQVIQLESQQIDTRLELPQVQILDRRKTSDFDEVKVEKSFRSDLSARTEELRFLPNTSGKVERIKNIDALINKKRF